MSTNSIIAVEIQPNVFKCIGVHFDGYLSHVGSILLNHYNTKELALPLISKKSYLWSLEENINKLEYDEDTEPCEEVTLDDIIKNCDIFIEYLYIFKDNKWVVYYGMNDNDEYKYKNIDLSTVTS